MSNIFCSQCGSKHSLASKFCSSCGASLSSFNKSSTIQRVEPVEVQTNEDTFIKPQRLAYEIENNQNSVYKGEDLFKSAPVKESDRLSRPVGDTKQMTKEEYLAESLRECATRGIQDINET